MGGIALVRMVRSRAKRKMLSVREARRVRSAVVWRGGEGVSGGDVVVVVRLSSAALADFGLPGSVACFSKQEVSVPVFSSRIGSGSVPVLPRPTSGSVISAVAVKLIIRACWRIHLGGNE